MPSENINTSAFRTFEGRAPVPAALNLFACQRLVREIEAHSTALRSWAGILLTRLHGNKPPHEGTVRMLPTLPTQWSSKPT